jgi:hypothetical protein
MSDTGQNRFEIDLDEIERQLRRSAELGPATPPPQSDPLAELARIVGQDDPFLGILGETKRPDGARERQEPTFGVAPEPVASMPRSQTDAVLTAEDRGVLGTAPLRHDAGELSQAPEPFDPVSRSYGGDSDALDSEDFTPMEPPRSRRRLGAVMALVALTGVGVAGAYTWRKMGGDFASSGPPPLIKADNAPLKVAPENPGGMDIPNQNKQIFEGRTDTARSRVLDRQEQPIDVREAARQMPAPETTPPPAVVPQPNGGVATAPAPTAPAVAAAPGVGAPASPTPAAPTSNGVNATIAAAAPPAPARNTALNALGEPRRVRTVAVRPDGSAIGASGGTMVSDPSAPILPTGQLPPPVSVATISIPANGGAAAPAPAAAAPPAPSATPVADGSTPATTATPVRVLPPSRPRLASAGADSEPMATGAAEQSPGSLFQPGGVGRTDANESAAPAETTGGNVVSVRPPSRPSRLGQQVAATSTIADVPEQQASEAPAGARSYAVQIAVRPTEAAARAAYDQLADKFATDLGGKPATVTEGKVNGRSVYRIRVTPLSREDANTLCTRLKASGGQCFVVAN